jgi:uncharacterized protein with PhoU and TrkA domain
MEENVKDLLEELKDISELMLDFGYSSVFFKSKDIAKEVEMLYDRLEILEEKLYLHLFAASRGRAVKKLISVIELVESAKKVASAARNLSGLVLENKELHPIIREALQQSDECISKIIISNKSELNKKTFADVRLRTNTGSQVIAIRRKVDGNKKWIFNPKKSTTILANDILIAIGTQNSNKKLKKIASGRLKLNANHEEVNK